ncbi:MAG: CUB domain-containing protein, partial [Saprospiraceae bacterium]
MKQFQLLFLILTFFTTTIFAQPPNDDCDGIIDLGVAPACQNDVIYSNVNATPSDIGAGNSPTCFNGGTTQRDVWFSFTTSSEISDYTFRIEGVENGDNATPIRNPQIALYRGSCQVNGLAELLCGSAPNGVNNVSLNAIGLSSGITYFLRVNDYSATGAPNFGDFTLCVDELSNEINIGESTGSVACSGTLYDSGGPDGNYGGNENALFTICPQEFNQCIVLDIQELALEDGFDRLRIYAGNDNNANNLIANLTGVIAANSFQLQASSECVTIEFASDPLISDTGFELTWACTPDGCTGSSIDNPTVIGSLPFNESTSTCGAAATFANSPCTGDEFLNGPEVVYTYDSPGGICAQIQLSDAAAGTGIAVFNGDPTDPNTECVARTPGSLISSANMEMAGTYYIVVANANTCTDYGININETECALSPALVDALCNPLNGCANDEGLPTQFTFEDGFQDIDIIPLVNGGCWTGTGLEPDFYWFSVQANADGDFGFILESADNPSDIDFNVWGPFTQEQVCENPDDVVAFVSSEGPSRSSYSPDPLPTGLINTNPITGEAVTDAFDCEVFGIPVPSAGGDSYVRTIDAQKDDVYVVLVNDWGNEIQSGGINVDFSPSDAEVLAPIPPEILTEDLSVCGGESAQIEIESAVGSIEWLNDTETLSCNDCFDPIATPSESTTYRAVVNGVCTSDTVE